MIYFRARELAMDHLGVGSRVDVDYDELGWWPARVAKCAEACVLVVAPDGTWSEKIPWDDVEHRCRAPRETRADRPASVSAARAEIALASANRFLSRAILNACSDMAFGAL